MREILDTFVGWFQANPSTTLYLLLLGFDMAFGTIRAFKEYALNSTISRNGVLLKATMILFLAMAEVLEPFSRGIPISDYVALLFSGTELLSIFENAKIIGVKGLDQLAAHFEKVVYVSNTKADAAERLVSDGNGPPKPEP